MSFRAATRLTLLTLLAAPIAAQAPREIPIGRPNATHPGEFSLLRPVREMTDGSVLVADPIEATFQRLDRTLARATALGRSGAGPGEHKQPDSVWPLPADSSLLVDLGNNRLTVVHPDGRLGATRILAEPAPGGRGLTLTLPSGVDQRGRVYYRGGRPGDDSLPIMRLDRGTGASTQVAMLKGPSVNQNSSGGENERREVNAPVPLAPADGFAVAPSGRVFLVRVADYHVDVINPDGSRVSGPRIPFTPVRITAADRAEFAASMRSGGALAVNMEIRNGEPSLSLNRGRLPDDAPIGTNFPATKPAFDPADLWVDGRGRLWVRRYQAAGQAALYDVFSERGTLMGSVRLPTKSRVTGMGTASVYVARLDDDDLQHLERYALPL
jgi:hypothetical protein